MLIEIICVLWDFIGEACVVFTLCTIVIMYYRSKNKKKEDNLCKMIKQWLMAPPAHCDEPILRHKMYDKKNDASEELKKLISNHEECKHDDCINSCNEEINAISQYVYNR